MSLSSRPPWQKGIKAFPIAGPSPKKVLPLAGASPRNSIPNARTQDVAVGRSHNNPLFGSKCFTDSPPGEVRRSAQDAKDTTPKASKESKENRDKQDHFNFHIEKYPPFAKSPISAGKVNKAASAHCTPPRSIAKRKILAENRELDCVDPKTENNLAWDTASEVLNSECVETRIPQVSMAELQIRIKNFLKDEDVESPTSPPQCAESLRRFSGAMSDLTLEEDLPAYHPVYAPFSPRPNFLRAKKIVSGTDENVSPSRSMDDDGGSAEKPVGYDPKLNFLSPRPQFLRYRPLRRLKLQRRGAEGVMDLGLESPPTDNMSQFETRKRDAETREVESSESSSSGISGIYTEEPYSRSSAAQLDNSPSIVIGRALKTCQSPDPLPSCKMFMINSPYNVDSNPSKAVATDTADCEGNFEVDVVDLENSTICEDEDTLEDQIDERSLLSGWKRSLVCSMAIFSVVSLVLLTSGSSGLLPRSLHGNRLSTIWHGSRYREQLQQIVGSREGLWLSSEEVPYFPRFVPDAVERNYRLLKHRVQTDGSGLPKNAKDMLVSSKTYMGHYYRIFFHYFRKAIATDNSNKHSLDHEVAEWEWQPEYDLGTASEMLEIGVFEMILRKIESLEAKMYWSSTFLRHFDREFSGAMPSFGGKTKPENYSTCPIPESSPSHSLLKPTAPIPVVITEFREQESAEYPVEDDVANALYEAEIRLVHRSQSVAEEADFHAPFLRKQVLGVNLDLTLVDIPLELSSHGSAVSSQYLDQRVHLNGPESNLEHIPPVDVSRDTYTSGAGENIDRTTSSDISSYQPDEFQLGDTDHFDGQAFFKGSLLQRARVSFLPWFWKTSRFLSVAVLSCFVATVVALMLYYLSRWCKARAGNDSIKRKVKFSSRLKRDAETKFPSKADRVQVLRHVEESWPTQAPSVAVHQPSSATEIVDRMSEESSIAFLTPETKMKKPSDRDNIMFSPGEVVDDSPFGSFTVVVPVVLNEGSGNEQVRLTPVRRSSRIRSRNLSPACNATHYVPSAAH